MTVGKLAIISYRIVKGDDGFTLSPQAFLAAIDTAAAMQVEFVWLDCWAYREQPPWGVYVHADFVRTLTTVMSQVHCVRTYVCMHADYTAVISPVTGMYTRTYAACTCAYVCTPIMHAD